MKEPTSVPGTQKGLRVVVFSLLHHHPQTTPLLLPQRGPASLCKPPELLLVIGSYLIGFLTALLSMLSFIVIVVILIASTLSPQVIFVSQQQVQSPSDPLSLHATFPGAGRWGGAPPAPHQGAQWGGALASPLGSPGRAR